LKSIIACSSIWDNEWLTNMELVLELEEKFSNLRVPNIIVTTMVPVPLKLPWNYGESRRNSYHTVFVATTAAIVWGALHACFCGYSSEYLTIDETKIEAVITDKKQHTGHSCVLNQWIGVTEALCEKKQAQRFACNNVLGHNNEIFCFWLWSSQNF
jgi:hypothetical protein